MRPQLTACLKTKETKLQLLLGQSTVKDKVRLNISSITGIESLNGAKRAVCVLQGSNHTLRKPLRHAIHTPEIAA